MAIKMIDPAAGTIWAFERIGFTHIYRWTIDGNFMARVHRSTVARAIRIINQALEA